MANRMIPIDEFVEELMQSARRAARETLGEDALEADVEELTAKMLVSFAGGLNDGPMRMG